MEYPIVIHKDKDSDYGVTVPDLPGCFSAGSTIDEAIEMAREAIELHLEGLIEDGELVPRPQPIEAHRDKREYHDGVWAVVSIASSSLRLKAKRVNITMPHRILDAVDRAAAAEKDTRSGLLAKAALAYINRRGARKTPSPSQRVTRKKGAVRSKRRRKPVGK